MELKIKNNRKIKGFTLIELMITVSIIGILSFIAIPSFQNYLAKAKLSEVMFAASICKTEVAEAFQTRLEVARNTYRCVCGDSSVENNCSQYLSQMTVFGTNEGNRSGRIDLRVHQNVGGGVAHNSIVSLYPIRNTNGDPVRSVLDDIYGWKCGTSVSKLKILLPSQCRS